MKNAMISKTIMIASSVVLLAGCATTPEQCDPYNRDASLVAKLSCDTSGAYRAQVEQREQQVRLDQEENALFHQVYSDIRAQQQATREDLSVQQEKQQALNSSLQTLLTRLQARSGEELGLQHRLNAIEQQLNANQEPARDEAEIEARRARLAELEQQVSRLQQSLGYE
ncbi:lipoprotein [Halomonas sp. GFAJ-1]|nr:lipoprotein [Halomonas sp. GFAJ-1]